MPHDGHAQRLQPVPGSRRAWCGWGAGRAAAGGRRMVVEGLGTGGTGPEAGGPPAGEGGPEAAGTPARVRQRAEAATERVAEAAKVRVQDAAGAARERLAGAGEAVRKYRVDMPWARSLPARVTRALVQRGL